MDEKQKVIEDFLKNLRVALNHATVYFKDHPVFTRAVDDLHTRLNSIFGFYDPFEVGVTPGYLMIDSVMWDKNKYFTELANIFHLRKIKKVVFKKGVTDAEIVQFLTLISVPLSSMTKEGKDNVALGFSNDSHIYLDGLDYFDLLRESGEGEKDIWAVLLKQAAAKPQASEFNEFSDNFSFIVDKFKGKDFIDNAALKDSIQGFLEAVKINSPDRYARCARELARVILHDKRLTRDERVVEFRVFFKDLGVVDLSNTLWDEIINDANFDFLTFKLFSQLVDKERHPMVAEEVAKRAGNDDILRNNVQIARRMKELFHAPDEGGISSVYRKALNGFLADAIASGGEVEMDRKQVHSNYRYVLLNLLMLESRSSMLKPALDKIVAQWGDIVEANDIEYIKHLLLVLDKKKHLDPELNNVFSDDEKMIFDFIENKVLEEDDIGYFDLYYDIASKARVSSDLYITRIFHNNKVTVNILKLFFKFFENNMDIFYTEMKKRYDDVSFIKKMITCLRDTDSLLGVKVLEAIFNFSDNRFQLDVIKAMRYMRERSLYDEQFLFSIVLTVNMYIRKESVAILVVDESLRGKIAAVLLDIKNIFGFKNQILLENIKIVEDIKLKEAVPYLEKISASIPWFKRDVCSRARTVLGKIGDKQ